MKPTKLITLMVVAMTTIVACNESNDTNDKAQDKAKDEPVYAERGFESQVAWGEHMVTILGCDDCHTPKTMTERGPQPDMSKRMMGHPADIPPPDIDREKFEKNGYIASNTNFTVYIGPWGISYAGNLTPHETGIGNWSQEQFHKAMRKGLFKGKEGGRKLLPPMPWQGYRHLSDEELNAMFAYLNSLDPIDNVVPSPQPPATKPKGGPPQQ